MQNADTEVAEPTHELSDRDKMRLLPWSYVHNAANSVYASLTFFGPVFILFLDELGLPKTRIGFLLSLLPFCGLMAPLIAPAVARAGVKRVYLVCWGLRKAVTALLLLVPWVLRSYGETAAFAAVAGVVVLFAVLRAVAETAWYPWFQEVVPLTYRGQYNGINRICALLAGSTALAAAGYVLEHVSGVERFSLLIGTGVIAGVICVVCGLPIPGGAPDRGRAGRPGLPMLRVLNDRRFCLYLAYAGLALLTLQAMLMAFVPLFMKEQVGLSEQQIILLQVGSGAAGLLSSYPWGRAADRASSKPVLQAALVSLLVLPLGWSLIPRSSVWSFPAALSLAVFSGAVSTGWWICDQRLLYVELVAPEKRTEYMAIYYAWIGLVGGCGPLAAGLLLDSCQHLQGELWIFSLNAYTPLFAASAVLLIAATLLLRRLRVG
jgi:MFS family permease